MTDDFEWGELPQVCLALELARHRASAGLGAPDLVAAYAAGGELMGRDAPAMLAEEAPSGGSDGVRRQRRVWELHIHAAAVAEETRVLAEEMAPPPGPLGFREARAALRSQPARGRRGELAEEALRALASSAGPRADRVEKMREASATLTGADPVSALSGFDTAAVVAAAERILAVTEDPCREVLGWAARRYVDAATAPAPEGDLSEADVVWLCGAQAEGSAFPAGGLRGTALSVLEAAGFQLQGRGLLLDLERRPGKVDRPLAARLGREDRVVAAVRPAGVPGDLRALLEALGRAHFLVGLSPAVPLEDRFCGDGAVALAHGLVLSRAVLEPSFLRGVLGATKGEASRAVRLLALGELLAIRFEAGQVLFDRELWRSGPGPARSALHAEVGGAALLARVDGRGYLASVGGPTDAFDRLRGRALAASLAVALTERFDEDWFRNPRAGPFLRDLGARPSGAEATAAAVGVELSLSRAIERPLSLL